jgi:glycerol transport system ATP-binding protein
VVQSGTPIELFEKPKHTFVGHFIGSPGMNLMPCGVKGNKAVVGGVELEAANAGAAKNGSLELGIRPEFIRFADKGLDASIVKVADIGRMRVVETRLPAGQSVKLLVPEGEEIPSSKVKLAFDPTHSFVYSNGWLAGEAGGATS